MKEHSLLMLIVSLLAAPIAAAPVAEVEESFHIYFWGGIECTGESTGSFGETDTPYGGCFAIPDPGVTSAADVYLSDNAILGLHSNNGCNDDGGIYEGDGNNAYCVQTNGATFFSVTSLASVEGPLVNSSIKSTDLAVANSNNEQVSTNLEISHDLDERGNPCYTVGFALGAGVAAGMFWTNAAVHCPATATDANVNSAACAISSVWGVVTTFLALFSVQGVARYGKAKRDIDAILPLNDVNLLDGYAVTIKSMDDTLSHPFPEGSGWSHYKFDAHSLDGSAANVSTVWSVHESGRNRITAPAYSVFDGFEKRSDDLVAYYGWTDGDASAFKDLPVCKGASAAKHGAEQLYNYGYSHNVDDFCANAYAGGNRLTYGNFAVLSGTFTDYAGQC